MNNENKLLKIAIIDDDDEWLKIVEDKILKEYNYIHNISVFNDFENFYKYEDIKLFDVIITDYYFKLYNLDSLDLKSILTNFKGQKILITGNIHIVINKIIFDKVINKQHIMKPTFKFSRHINGLVLK